MKTHTQGTPITPKEAMEYKEIAPGHNPAQLTVDQVGEGYELLPESLVGVEVDRSKLERWHPFIFRWISLSTPLSNHTSPNHTYRLTWGHTADDLVKKPDPFEEWFKNETNLPGKHHRLARSAWDAAIAWKEAQQ